MSEQSADLDGEMSIIKVLKNWDIMKIAVEKPPQPDDTLREIAGLYNIMKVHLFAVIQEELHSNKLKVKDVVSLTKELEKLLEMLFVFKVKTGELNKRDKPKRSEILMEVLSDLKMRDKVKIKEAIEAEIKLIEEDEHDGSTNEQNDG